MVTQGRDEMRGGGGRMGDRDVRRGWDAMGGGRTGDGDPRRGWDTRGGGWTGDEDMREVEKLGVWGRR